MARISGVDLPREKRMEIALTYIFGIGRSRSREILAETGIDPDLRSKDLERLRRRGHPRVHRGQSPGRG